MKRMIKIILNCLIVSYLSLIYFTGVPETNTLNLRIKDKAMKVAFVIGIWPSWSMFAPNPIKFDSKTYVEIKYQNGEVKEFDVEKPLSGPLATFRKARWMKYSQDNLRNPTQRALLRPAIKYFTKKYGTEANPVVDVAIKRKWKDIHPFSDHQIPSISETPRTEQLEVLMAQKITR